MPRDWPVSGTDTIPDMNSSSTTACKGFEPGLCMLGCSGAMDVASELAFVALSVDVKVEAGDTVRVGWLTDLCRSLIFGSTFFLRSVLGFG